MLCWLGLASCLIGFPPLCGVSVAVVGWFLRYSAPSFRSPPPAVPPVFRSGRSRLLFCCAFGLEAILFHCSFVFLPIPLKLFADCRHATSRDKKNVLPSFFVFGVPGVSESQGFLDCRYESGPFRQPASPTTRPSPTSSQPPHRPAEKSKTSHGLRPL